MSAKVSSCDFLEPNWERFVELMSETEFYKLSRTPTPCEKKATEKDPVFFHAVRLFKLSEIWADPLRIKDAEAERIEKMERFAIEVLLQDLNSKRLKIPEISFDGVGIDQIKLRLRELAVQKQEESGQHHPSPTLVYWLSLHGFGLSELQDFLSGATELLLSQEDCLHGEKQEQEQEQEQESKSDSQSILRTGSSTDMSLSSAESSPIFNPRKLTIETDLDKDQKDQDDMRKVMGDFSLDNQMLVYYRCLFSAFFLAFDQEDRKAPGKGSKAKKAKPLSSERVQSWVRSMIAKTCGELIALSPSNQSTIRRSDGSHHLHRRRLSVARKFSCDRQELIEGCPEIYRLNPLHIVLDYLDDQIRNYEIHSNDWRTLSKKREIVTEACRRVDGKQGGATKDSVTEAVKQLLLEDALYERRNKFDCFHETPKTIQLIQAASLENGAIAAIEKLLPKSVLSREKHSKIKQALERVAEVY